MIKLNALFEGIFKNASFLQGPKEFLAFFLFIV
jgi:hypothetical protein